jgi:hypothetical protein
MTNPAFLTMKALRLRSYGEPTDVLHLEEVAVPSPGANQIRVRVQPPQKSPALGGHLRDRLLS